MSSHMKKYVHEDTWLEHKGRIHAAWVEVMDELESAMKQHPNYPDDPLRRIAIMVEEAGEAMKEAVDLTRSPTIEVTEYRRISARLRYEVVQTAAMCVRFLAAGGAQ